MTTDSPDSITRDQLLAAINTKYLSSEEFNGFPLRIVDLPRNELDALLRELVV